MGTAPSPQGENGLRGVGGPVAALFKAYGPWFLGVCFCNVWIGWMNGAHAMTPVELWDALCAAVMVATLLVGAWYGRRHPDGMGDAYAADWPIAVGMALFTLPAAGMPVALPAPFVALGTVVTEVGMAWLYVRWGVFLSRLDIRSTVGCIFIAHVLGCTAKFALYFIPTGVSALPVALLPVASMLFLRRALGRACGTGEPGMQAAPPGPVTRQAAGHASFRRDEGSSARACAVLTSSCRGAGAPAVWCTGQPGGWGPVWKVAAFVFCYRLLFQGAALVDVPAGGASLSLSAVCCLAEVAVTLLILYMLLVRSGSFTFQQVWSIFLLLMGVVLLCEMLEETVEVAMAVRAASGSLLVMFSWLVFADISHHSTVNPLVVFSVARIAYELPRLLVQALALAFPFPQLVDEARLALVGILFFALLVFAIWFFDWRDPTLALLFTDFQGPSTAPEPDAVLVRCAEAADEFGLTQREAQVLPYLCQGRTRAYIAETLYLSENTVRGHTQRIYAKLGVHNKTELQRKLGV